MQEFQGYCSALLDFRFLLFVFTELYFKTLYRTSVAGANLFKFTCVLSSFIWLFEMMNDTAIDGFLW